MATKKTSIKKTAAKKAITKKTTAKNSRSFAASKTLPRSGGAGTRRPAVNLPPQPAAIDAITNTVMGLIEDIDKYTANLRALDRQRHNGVGMKRLGFIEEIFRISKRFPQYFPHWLDTMKFQNDLLLFRSISSLLEACRSLEEKAWNINVESSDMIYTNALEYYSQVQDAAKRRVDAAENLYEELHGFFKKMGPHENPDQPTQKQTKRDINSLLHGKKDGEVIIRNISPKITGGTHEIIDETFKSNASFKETDEASIK
jgi:hypothetical protein